MLYLIAYYDVIDDFMTIHNFLKTMFLSIIYIINDVIVYCIIIHFPVILCLNINSIYSATIYDMNEDYLLKICEVITFCNDIIYYETLSVLYHFEI